MQSSKLCSSAIKLLCLVLFLTIGYARATTIRVPADQPTIQAGIDVASNGDTVLVAPGTYYENIDFKGKAITVTSSDGAAKTIIDGSNGGSVVKFTNKELRSSIISNFTLRNGSFSVGAGSTAGVLIGSSAPTVLNNIITSNVCSGIDVEFAAPLIQGNVISNTTSGNLPGQSCGVVGVVGVLLGGRYFIQPNLYPVVIGNTIESNRVGGGIEIWAADNTTIQGNIIRNNNNVSNYESGGITLYNSDAVSIIENLIYGNSSAAPALQGGAGIKLLPPGQSLGPFLAFIVNNTITGNFSSQSSPSATVSQVYLEGNLAQYVVVNNIINGANSGPAMVCGTAYNYLSLTPLVFDHNDIYNSQGPAYGGACPDQSGSYGNISAAPLFASPASGDYHVLQGSPTIDAGNNSSPLLPSKDFDKNPRLADSTGKGYPIVDMGAYEFAGQQNANPTLLTLTPSTYETYGGGSLTLTAKLTSANGTPTGPVTFFEDDTRIGAGLIDTTGTVTFAVQGLVPGAHAFLATYAGESSFTAAVSVKFYVLIDKYIPTLKLTSSANPALLNQPVTLTITATSPDNIVLSPITLTDGQTTLTTLTPNSNGVATFTTSAFTLGTHYLNASYAGDTAHAAANAFLNQVIANGYTTPSTLTSSLNPATIGQSVTFTDTVTFNGSATTSAPGTITFYDNNGTTLLGSQAITAQPNSTATATFTTSTLAIGTHNISAVLSSANAYASTATLNQVILGVPTTTALAASPNPTDALQPVTLNATVSSAVTTPAFTGSVTFYDGSTALSSAPVDSAGHATYTTSSLAGGNHLLHAVYNGDTTFASSTSFNVSETIRFLPSTTALTISPTPSVAFQIFTMTAQVSPLSSSPSNAPGCNCTVTFTANALPANLPSVVTVPVNNGLATYPFVLPVGTYTFTASFNGSTVFAPSNSAPVQQIVVPAATTTSLTASPNPVVQNKTLTLTAVIAAPASADLIGNIINFYDGTALLSTAPLNTKPLSNTATVTASTNTLTAGTHIITAAFAGNSNFLPSVSAPVTVTVTPQDFALAVSNPTMTIQTEHHLATRVTLTSIGAFADKISLACANLPPHASCTFDPASLQLLPNGTATANLIVDTDDVHGFRSSLSPQPRPGAHPLNPIAFGFLLPTGFLALPLLSRRRRPLPHLLLLIGAIVAATLSLTGCDGLYPASTAPGIYTIQVTAAGATSGLSHSTSIQITVTK
ncbi:Ig-like domain repeat protein [Edaphobacter flagellatus]|uniref:Ig-like domain repeat protein n=1 Tax=Edaphobacter flagellatus TaxID=1933044 RepID=UPI0028C44B76|nr:Ig-like domain repeat protein [Edaphobacter flagellatus]